MKSKHYYETDRNLDNARKVNDNHTTDLIDKSNDSRVPEYYRGINNYEARKVCDNFELPYHLATATTYILRSYHKHDSPVECLQKAINHLQFEIEKYEDESR